MVRFHAPRDFAIFPAFLFFLCPTSHPLVTNLGRGRKISSNEKCKRLVSLERDPFSFDEKKKREKEDRKEKKKKKEGIGESRRIGVEEEQEEER